MDNTLLASLRRHQSLMQVLVKREFAGRYRGSFGGVLWSFVQPLFLLGVYTLAFGVILKTRWGFTGTTTDFAFLLFAGLIVFNLFSECLIRSVHLVSGNPNFVKKVVFPLELLPVICVASALLHALIAALIWVMGYTVLYGLPHATVLLAPLVIACLLPFLLGVGWILSSVGVIIRDIGQITGMLSHTLLFLTPIFYSVDMAPPMIRSLLLLNPLTFIVDQFRVVLFYGQSPDFAGLALYFIAMSLFAFAAYGLFQKLRPNFADLV
jgi:lipopolysaccharide transport system permease protein